MLLIDYTWRQYQNLAKDIFRSRHKLIVDVQKVDAVNIHYHGVGPLFIPESPHELRVDHYKKTDNGVFNTFNKQWLSGPAIIEDTLLRDEYHNIIVECLALVREGTPY